MCLKRTLAFWHEMTDADTISLTSCFSLTIVFKFIAVTITGGISTTFFEEDETRISLGESTVISNLHQLTCAREYQQISDWNFKKMHKRFYRHDFKRQKIHRIRNLTLWGAGQVENFDTDNQEGPFTFLLTRKSSKALHMITQVSTLSSKH